MRKVISALIEKALSWDEFDIASRAGQTQENVMLLLLRLQTFMREINDENAKGITDAASGLAQSLADLKLRLRSEADRGKIEPIRTTVLPDFTAKVGELITMLNEANEVDRSVLLPNGAAIAEKVGQMRTNALAPRATAESATAAQVDAVRLLTPLLSLAARVPGPLPALLLPPGLPRP